MNPSLKSGWKVPATLTTKKNVPGSASWPSCQLAKQDRIRTGRQLAKEHELGCGRSSTDKPGRVPYLLSAVVFVLLVLIGGSVWWFGFRQHHEIQQITAEARHITREKIRAQLLESAQRIHQAALAEAAKAKGWDERERLRKAAEQAYAGRLSRIDELADSFADIEGTSRSTQIFDEMTRILAKEGIDQAFAYVATQRSGIL